MGRPPCRGEESSGQPGGCRGCRSREYRCHAAARYRRLNAVIIDLRNRILCCQESPWGCILREGACLVYREKGEFSISSVRCERITPECEISSKIRAYECCRKLAFFKGTSYDATVTRPRYMPTCSTARTRITCAVVLSPPSISTARATSSRPVPRSLVLRHDRGDLRVAHLVMQPSCTAPAVAGLQRQRRCVRRHEHSGPSDRISTCRDSESAISRAEISPICAARSPMCDPA